MTLGLGEKKGIKVTYYCPANGSRGAQGTQGYLVWPWTPPCTAIGHTSRASNLAVGQVGSSRSTSSVFVQIPRIALNSSVYGQVGSASMPGTAVPWWWCHLISKIEHYYVVTIEHGRWLVVCNRMISVCVWNNFDQNGSTVKTMGCKYSIHHILILNVGHIRHWAPCVVKGVS